MSIGSDEVSSTSIQARPGPAAAGLTSSTDPETVPRTPTPPLPSGHQESSQISPQQQQNQQHHQNKPSIHSQSQQNVTSASSTSTVAPSEANPASSSAVKPIVAPATVRPPPPASAVSLHAAAAAANKQSVAPGTSAPRDVSTAASNGKTSATSPPKKQTKPRVNKAPDAAKTKQKRKSNQSGASDELVYRPAPSTAGGTIGAAPDATIPAMLSAAGGGRKALPELVLPFQLPFVDVRPDIPMLDNASLQAAMAMGASETSSLDTGSDSDDYSVQSDDSDLDSEAEESRREARRRRREPATIEESLVLLQSLRQSRLSHLSSLLTPFSQRVRSGMIYPNVLPLSLLHGLNPRDPHVLIQLGRADIHVGPHVFLKTKFWEVRPDYESPHIMNPLGGIHAPASYGPSSVYPRMSVPAPMPQQLPQPQPPKLPSPRAAPTPVVAQPSVPLARPPTATNKSPIARPATTVAPAGAASTAASAASRPTSLPTPTLPATPMQSSAAVRPAVLPKPAAASSSTVVSAPAVKLPLAGAGAGSAPTPASVPATTLPPAPKAVVPAAPSAPSAPVSGTTTVTSTTADSKPAAVVTNPASVPQAPKPVTVPVSLPRPPMATPSLPRPPSINQSNIPSSSNPATTSPSSTATSSAAPSKAPSPVGASTAKSVSASANAAATPAAATTTTTTKAAVAPAAASGSTASNTASAAAKPAASATANTNAANSPAPARPAGVPPPPAIDAVLVSRVNATAALNPELQELLHIAASGKANPNQLKALGVWIQAITAQLRQDEARNAAATNSSAAGASGSRAPGNTASTTAEGKKSKKNKVDEAAKASKKQAKIEEREAKKKAKAEAKAKAQADKQQTQKQHKQKQQPVHQQHHSHQQQQQSQAPVSNKLRHPPPGWPTDGPPKPPVIIVEFRENPSMRFILPLWKCLVERTEGIERPSLPKVKKERRSFFDNDSDDEESQRIEPELKLSFFAPSLGSDAADGSGLRELEEELKRKAAEEAKLNAAGATSTGAQSTVASSSASPEAASAHAASDKTVEDGTSLQGKKKKGGVSGGSKKGGKPIKQEASDPTASSDYSHSKKHEVYPLTWSIKGGVTESLWEAFGRVPGTMTCQPVKREPEIELEPDVAEFLVPEIRYHLLDLPMEEFKIQKETTDTFVDLYSQMPDRRFILPRVAPALLPQGLEDHLQDRFAVRPQCMQDRPVVKRKAGAREDDVSFSYEGIGLTVIGPNGVKTEPGAAAPPKPPKRKRHVATHNPDGSIKSCGACGKTKTPMWRRGPKGPSQLCNACGARWKAGRLVVPEVAPPPIIEAEEDKSKEDEARKEDEAQASMHGSNALVIPQSSSADDGSYTVMASSGMVGAAPFGDHYSLSPEDKSGMDFGASHLSRGSSSPSPFIRSPIPEDDVMPASVDPSMLSGSNRALSRR